MIERAPMSEKRMTYDDAVLYCQFLEYNDHRDWRMPTRSEWVKLECKPRVTWYQEIIREESVRRCVHPVRAVHEY